MVAVVVEVALAVEVHTTVVAVFFVFAYAVASAVFGVVGAVLATNRSGAGYSRRCPC